jgi:hypothetical protein
MPQGSSQIPEVLRKSGLWRAAHFRQTPISVEESRNHFVIRRFCYRSALHFSIRAAQRGGLREISMFCKEIDGITNSDKLWQFSGADNALPRIAGRIGVMLFGRPNPVPEPYV